MSAVPFTVALTVDSREGAAPFEATARLATPTFDTARVKYPLQPLVRFPEQGYVCPPCKVAETNFNAGVGLPMVPGGGTNVFGVLLEIIDEPEGAKRSEDGLMLKVIRRSICAFRGSDDATQHVLSQHGPL